MRVYGHRSELLVEDGKDGGVCLYQARAKPSGAAYLREGVVKVRNVTYPDLEWSFRALPTRPISVVWPDVGTNLGNERIVNGNERRECETTVNSRRAKSSWTEATWETVAGKTFGVQLS